MLSHTLFIEPNTMNSKDCVKKIIEFYRPIGTKITFSKYLDNHNLSLQEYEKACNDFSDYYSDEDEKRRKEFMENAEYRSSLLTTYHSWNEAIEFLDRCRQYDLVELDEVRKTIQQYRNVIKQIKVPAMSKQRTMLPKEALIGSRFTCISHCTIGGLWKVYDFLANGLMIKSLLVGGDLFKYYVIEGTEGLEDPAFYSGDKLVLSICTHERTTALYLSEEQYASFKNLKIPYIKGR